MVCPLGANAAAPYRYSGMLTRGQTLDVQNVNGDVTIVPGTRLDVRATKTADRGNPDDVKILHETSASGIRFCVHYPGDDSTTCGGRSMHHNAGGDNDTRVDFQIAVPPGVLVEVASVNGNVSVRSDALAEAQTVNGKIAVDAGDLRTATTVNGSIVVRVHDTASSVPMKLTTVNGTVSLALPRTVGLDVHASVLNGNIDALGLDVHRPQYGPGAHVDGKVGDGRRALDLHALNGSIHLTRD